MLQKLRGKMRHRFKRLFMKSKPKAELVPPIQTKNVELPYSRPAVSKRRLSLGNRIPPDILEMIFDAATYIPGALDTVVFLPKYSKENEYSRLKERRTMAWCLVQVCKEWHYAAMPFLYRLVMLDSEDSVRLLAATLAGYGGEDAKVVYGSHTRRMDLYLDSESAGDLFGSLHIPLLCMPELLIFRWRHPIAAVPLSYDDMKTRPDYILNLLRFLPRSSLKVLDCVDGLPRLRNWELRETLKHLPLLETLNMPIWGGGSGGGRLKLSRMCSLDISRMVEITFRIRDEMPSLIQIVDSIGGWGPGKSISFGYERLQRSFGVYFHQLRSFVLKADPAASPQAVRHYVENVSRKLSNLVNFTLILDNWNQLPEHLCIYNAAFFGVGLLDPRSPFHAPESDDDGHYRRFFDRLSGIVVHPAFEAVYFLDDALYHHSAWQKHRSWHSVARLLISFKSEILARDSTTLVPFPPDLPELPSTSIRIKDTMASRPLLPPT
ncbi:hypothetical protein NEOLEDRAFT_1183952 [Neolentinus lepideus HHB14362 ss-1]|uniref:Uncharacterized protein n=1 Tax=Neolentinus lepideus HHB14362 ss-1 TaxID=1314782 RepID=A0A165MVG9_9AGAM|nr:hypothetical protein NEOLEDRAFT_1183952 [Neolentinus lepideus HHB14362 ss-1]